MKPAVIVILLLLILLPAQGWGGRRRQSPKAAAVADAGYVFALGIANRFLNAWEAGDLETGMVLLSDRVRHALLRIARELPAGDHRLRFELVGKNAASKGWGFDLSNVVFERVR